MVHLAPELLQLILEEVAAPLARSRAPTQVRLVDRPALWTVEAQLLQCMMVSKQFHVSFVDSRRRIYVLTLQRGRLVNRTFACRSCTRTSACLATART